MATNKPLNRENILAVAGDTPATLGRVYRDLITGISGIATSRTTFLYSCVRVAVQPQKPTKDNEVPDAFFFDEKQIEGVGLQVIPYQEEAPVCILGHIYKDSITGFTGVAVSVTKFLYAAERTVLQLIKLKDGIPIDAQAFDSGQLIDTKAKSKAPKASKSNERPGGPGDVAQAHLVPSNHCRLHKIKR